MGSFYDRHVLPKLLGFACGSPPIMKQRAKVVPKASGRVLELGIGMGKNLAFYDPAQVQQVLGVDPSPGLRAAAAAAARPEGLDVAIEDGTAEALPFETRASTRWSAPSPSARSAVLRRRWRRPGGC